MTTQGDIGPMTEFTDEEPEFPGPGSTGRMAEHDVDLLWETGEAPDSGSPELGPDHPESAVPQARTEWRRLPVMGAYEPMAGEEWGSHDARDSGAERAGWEVRGPYVDGVVRDDRVEHLDYHGPFEFARRVPFEHPEFTVFRTHGRLAPELAETAYVEPVSMLTEWFGEADAILPAPAVEHGSPSPTSRMTKPQKRTHRARRDPADRAPEIAAAADARSARAGWEFAAAFVVSALVLTALLYSFGWARAAARSDYLGFDESVLGTPARAYVLDGLRTLRRPLLALVALLLAARVAHPRLLVWLRRHRRVAAWFTWALRCAWFAVPGAAWLGVHRWPARGAQWWPMVLPGGIAAGLLIAAYGVLLSRRIGAHRRSTGTGGRPWSLSVVLTGAVVVLCLFWASGAYARVSGHDAGRAVAHQLPRSTAVVLYSVQDLRMGDVEGVAVQEETGASYRYRYTGLRLLRRASGTLFLLPERWSWERPRLLVVHEDARLRVEYERTR
ncbi:hypothetical protein [Embleya sp. NBC_00896]|uniref:hypothetical protein n=1 Tax=Embleya sp. NBC_00896 TaxID=2975961 RepID=UPI00386A188C|nr:hypothetical protein OG928_15880 [Embleya sp. NBC_00896]